ncbi:MAG: Gfo/Idh/MocA family oxidoreductase [Schumannella sp.]|nr:Gfo/Idh/MocA family oxidoreductase [Microbacteriaceae bacterium]
MPLPRSLPDATNTPLRGGPVLRWGVLAPGRIADDWVRTVHAHTDQRVLAVASRDAERAAGFASRHGIPRWHEGYEALVADPEIDVVYVSPPHVHHVPLALLAISAGKHVLIEKPLATTEADVRRVAEAAREAGVFAMEAMWTRFLPQTTVLRRLLDDGALGRPVAAAADFGIAFGFDATSRAYDPAAAGGALLDLGIYPLWFTAFALGDASRVTARGSLTSTGVEEQAAVLTEHEGGLGAATASMIASTPNTAFVAGESGRVEIDGPFWSPGGFRMISAGGELRYADPSALRHRDGLAYQAATVAAHIAEGRTEAPEHPLERTARLLRTIDEARRQVGVVT